MHRSDLHMRAHRVHIGLTRQTCHAHQSRTTGVKLHCGIFIVADVRAIVTINAPPRGGQSAQGKGICRRAS